VTAIRVGVVTVLLCALLWAVDWSGFFPDAALAVRWGAHAPDAVRAVPRVEVARGWPVLSLVMADEDLHGPRGLLSNVLEHGPEWERPGAVAYFERGTLRFSTDVGVRVHGGGSRMASPRQGFRLYFRKRHGGVQMAGDVLFEPDAQPIRRLVVHNDVRPDADGLLWRLVNPLAYDIAEAIGVLAPDTKPVRFLLNGQLQGMYVLTERIDEEFFAAHLGHRRVRAEQAEFDELWRWVSGTRPLRMADAARVVDVPNLTRWFLAAAFCATRDAYQGPGQFKDLTRREAPWFWVGWDMDTSFRRADADSYTSLLEPVGGPRRGRNPAEPRAVLIAAMLEDDPAYREYFAAEFDRVMNHVLTPEFLQQRVEHYRSVAIALAQEDLTFIDRMVSFMTERPAMFRRLTEQRLNLAVGTMGTTATPRWEATPLRWVRIPAGTFEAGCLRDDPDCDGNERPAEPAAIERPFAMLATEVTIGQYAAWAGNTGRSMPRQPDWFATSEHPVVHVTWDEASAFCEALQGRLPTELEWEYAARGGTAGRLFPWPGGFDGQANLEDEKNDDRFPLTAPVGSFAPNGFGLFDMIGNVWEWTSDRYDSRAPADRFDVRAVRGGSWLSGPRLARISERAGVARTTRHPREVGFRCVRD
jgi:formylglycine-generating enzyme required for sulfatase activity